MFQTKQAGKCLGELVVTRGKSSGESKRGALRTSSTSILYQTHPCLIHHWDLLVSLVAQMVKNLPAMQRT